MKFVDKKELRIENGYILDKDNTVMSLGVVSIMFNALETAIQYGRFISENKVTNENTVEEFQRKSCFETAVMIDPPATPVQDRKVRESMALLEEIKAEENHKDTVALIDKYNICFEFCKNDKCLVSEAEGTQRIDTPTLGNILELTVEELLRLVKSI